MQLMAGNKRATSYVAVERTCFDLAKRRWETTSKQPLLVHRAQTILGSEPSCSPLGHDWPGPRPSNLADPGTLDETTGTYRHSCELPLTTAGGGGEHSGTGLSLALARNPLICAGGKRSQVGMTPRVSPTLAGQSCIKPAYPTLSFANKVKYHTVRHSPVSSQISRLPQNPCPCAARLFPFSLVCRPRSHTMGLGTE